MKVQTLDITPRLWSDLVNGNKKSTIRFAEPEIVIGKLKFVCSGRPELSVFVNVWRVSNLPLLSVAAFLDHKNDWPDEILLVGMREHYPQIELTDIVQVVEYSLGS